MMLHSSSKETLSKLSKLWGHIEARTGLDPFSRQISRKKDPGLLVLTKGFQEKIFEITAFFSVSIHCTAKTPGLKWKP